MILSLTSYPPRFRYLTKHLLNLQSQSKYPDLLVINIAQEDMEDLPIEVKNLKLDFPHQINTCEDLGPGKKLLPTLKRFNNSTIVTIDDDMLYPVEFLENLMAESMEFPGEIIAARAHRPRFLSRKPIRYLDWDFEIESNSDFLVMPTSGGGVLYPPYSLHQDALDYAKYLELSYTTDDLWYWVHAIRQGTKIRKTRNRIIPNESSETKNSGLSSAGNIEYINDLNLKLLWENYNVEKCLANLEIKNSFKLLQVDERKGSQFESVTNLDIEELNNFLLSLQPRNRLIIARIIKDLDVELTYLKRSHRDLRVSFKLVIISLKLVYTNLLRKIRVRRVNG